MPLDELLDKQIAGFTITVIFYSFSIYLFFEIVNFDFVFVGALHLLS